MNDTNLRVCRFQDFYLFSYGFDFLKRLEEEEHMLCCDS
jgi:hypothetical protein